MWSVFGFCVLIAVAVGAEELKLCVNTKTITDQQCINLERGDSVIRCEKVNDAANCAIRMSLGKAHFGSFTAEELFLTHQFYKTGLQIVAELRNKDLAGEPFEFQSVVIVPSSYVPSKGGFGALKGTGLCHPGFSETQNWSDYVLKYFEEKVYDNICNSGKSTAESELINLRDYFSKACRPGQWVSDKKFDLALKKKYPELCALCDHANNCTYSTDEYDGHIGALNCLTSGRGKAAYTSLKYALDYFAANRRSDFNFLCPDGKVQPLTQKQPCTWFRQPWPAVVAKVDKAAQVIELLKTATIVPVSNEAKALIDALEKDAHLHFFDSEIFPQHYLEKGRDVNLPDPRCGETIRWCTTSEMELNKCNWVTTAARGLGISPKMNCHQTNSSFECFHDVMNKKADIITIDSNYGYLARKKYSLSPVLYSETDKKLNSFVVAVIREKSITHRSGSMTPITHFSQLRGKNVCFPEYGGIAWINFLRVMQANKLIPNTCKYADIAADFLNGACAPGAFDSNHNVTVGKEAVKVLCKLCPDSNCDASHENSYFGDAGTIKCLEGPGDAAFLEVGNIRQFIKDGTINETHYRVLCKNGTLARYTGFDVHEDCALSVTIDSEVISRREESESRITDITLALLKIEKSLGYSKHRAPIYVYDSFNGTKDLLFKDSATALVTTNEEIKSVKAYKELFKHVDACSNASAIQSAVKIVLAIFLIGCLL